MMVFPSCAQRGRAAALAEGALVPGTHCPRRLLLQDETSRDERERELGRAGANERRRRERKRRRAAVSQPGGGGPERPDSGALSLSFSLSLSLSVFLFLLRASSRLLLLLLLSFARPGPVVAAEPRRAAPESKPPMYVCMYVYTPPDRNPPSGSRSPASGPLFSSPGSRSLLPLLACALPSDCCLGPARARARSLIRSSRGPA